MRKKKLYEVTNTNNSQSWDYFDSVLLIADTLQEAIELVRKELYKDGMQDDWETEPDSCSYLFIGNIITDFESKILLSSFNAG